jgi:hypothetical protein
VEEQTVGCAGAAPVEATGMRSTWLDKRIVSYVEVLKAPKGEFLCKGKDDLMPVGEIESSNMTRSWHAVSIQLLSFCHIKELLKLRIEVYSCFIENKGTPV